MENTDFTWLFIQMLLALGVTVLVAVILLRFVVPRLSWTKKFKENPYFKIVSRFTLEHKKSLYLIKAGDKNLVIGVTETGIHKLAELANEDIHP